MPNLDPVSAESTSELARLAQAVWSFGKPAGMDRAFVVMSKEPPLHRVLTIEKTLAAAREVLLGKSLDAIRYVPESLESFRIYEVSLRGEATSEPSSIALNQIGPVCIHNCYCEWVCPQQRPIGVTRSQIDHFELVARDANGQALWSFDEIAPDADVVTIGDSKMKQLLMSYFSSTYGAEYVPAMHEFSEHLPPFRR